VSTTRLTWRINAPRARVYRALLDPRAEFETTDPVLEGEMTITYTLADSPGGTEVHAVHDGLPPGVPAADNEAGWRMSLAKLAALVEAAGESRPR